MAIIVNLDVMLARRKMKSRDLAAAVGITEQNISLLKSGKVRALAVASASRLPELQNVPTFAEAGYPGFEVNAWYALYAPAKTSKEVLARLNTSLTQVLKQPEVQEKFALLGVRTRSGSSQELAKFTTDEWSRYGKVIQSAGIRID